MQAADGSNRVWQLSQSKPRGMHIPSHLLEGGWDAVSQSSSSPLVPPESAMLLTANTTFMPSSTSAALVMTCGATVY